MATDHALKRIRRHTLAASIGRVIDSVERWHRPDLERIDTLEASNVVAVFARNGPSPVVCMDAAARAEVMLRGFRVELVELEALFATNHFEARQGHRGDDCALPAANRAIAAARIDDAIGKGKLEHHRPAVARCPVNRPDFSPADVLDHALALVTGSSRNRRAGRGPP